MEEIIGIVTVLFVIVFGVIVVWWLWREQR
jgi:ABC-type spermidine/putrescine transport system permease subunit II